MEGSFLTLHSFIYSGASAGLFTSLQSRDLRHKAFRRNSYQLAIVQNPIRLHHFPRFTRFRTWWSDNRLAQERCRSSGV